MHLTRLLPTRAALRRLRARLAEEDGITMATVVLALMTVLGLSAAAFGAAQGDLNLGRYDQDEKLAYAAAEAGLNDYMFHLAQDNAYWSKCTNVPSPAPVNQAWNGTGADPRRWRTLPGSSQGLQYTIELIPANGATSCQYGNAQATMIDASSGTFRIRATGRSRSAKRSIVATFRRRNFLDYLYFTDYETSDPTWYELDTYGRPTRSGGPPSWSGPTLIEWGNDRCVRYWRQGRGSQSFSGQIYWFDDRWRTHTDSCTEIQFAPGDKINGPFHTNDEILVCGSPDFGRNAQDRIEVSGPGWRGNSSCSGNNPTFVGTWAPNSPMLTLPPSDTSLKQVAENGGQVYEGRTTIVLGGSSMTVNGVSKSYPGNGVIYVKNGTCGQGYKPLDPYNAPAGCADVYVKGSYSEDLTIASEKDIIVNGDITRNGDKMLGLISNNFIRVYHPVSRSSSDPTQCSNASGTMFNVRIDAAMLSLQHSFTVDNYYCGAALGTLTVNGTIGQKFRGPVGRGGNSVSNGYTKNYNYDDRLKFRSPPHFLDPVQSAWRIQRYTEQVPAR